MPKNLMVLGIAPQKVGLWHRRVPTCVSLPRLSRQMAEDITISPDIITLKVSPTGLSISQVFSNGNSSLTAQDILPRLARRFSEAGLQSLTFHVSREFMVERSGELPPERVDALSRFTRDFIHQTIYSTLWQILHRRFDAQNIKDGAKNTDIFIWDPNSAELCGQALCARILDSTIAADLLFSTNAEVRARAQAAFNRNQLPYQITTPLLTRLLEAPASFTDIREFALTHLLEPSVSASIFFRTCFKFSQAIEDPRVQQKIVDLASQMTPEEQFELIEDSETLEVLADRLVKNPDCPRSILMAIMLDWSTPTWNGIKSEAKKLPQAQEIFTRLGGEKITLAEIREAYRASVSRNWNVHRLWHLARIFSESSPAHRNCVKEILLAAFENKGNYNLAAQIASIFRKFFSGESDVREALLEHEKTKIL